MERSIKINLSNVEAAISKSNYYIEAEGILDYRIIFIHVYNSSHVL